MNIKEQIKQLQAELFLAKNLLRYTYNLPMNEAGGYEENIAWKDACKQVLKDDE